MKVHQIRPNPQFIIIAFVTVAAVMSFAAYVSTSKAIGDGDIIVPLDDAYIHFQYARQLAEGEPYVYNPGEEPTSGATSFIYPFILSIGHLIGFHELALGYWALFVGLLALITGAVLLYYMAKYLGCPQIIAGVMTLLFVTNGPVTWHYFSGMETGLVITLTLATLYTFVTQRDRSFIVAATLLALARPEGSIMALIAVASYVLRRLLDHKSTSRANQLSLIWFALPVAAIGVQPLLNLLITGSASAAGSQAKSILGTIPFYMDDVIGRITDNFVRMWREFATGTNGDYIPIGLVLVAVIGLLGLLIRRDTRYPGLLIILWLFAITAAISTLDTAFWHFKRYQMPLIVLMFPLAAWGITLIWQRIPQQTVRYMVFTLATLILMAQNATIWLEFQRLYDVNLNNIAAQPLPMARWLAANTPEDAIVAVHDVGMMRYVGNRHTVDMVGLTTTGAADYWRNGPGSVAEFLLSTNPQPDYVAAYTTARGLNYLTETSLYGDLLVGFTAAYDPADNVALGAEFQGIYRVDWDRLNRVNIDLPLQSSLAHLIIPDTQPIASINVANLTSEAAYDYEWSNQAQISGFVTETYEWPYIACTQADCLINDGGRLINERETFHVEVESCTDLLLVSRVHPVHAGTLDVLVNGTLIDTQWIPSIPGTWLEIPTYIDAQFCEAQMQIEVHPNITAGFYMPYQHWLLPAEPQTEPAPSLASFQDGAIEITGMRTEIDENTLTVDIEWQQGSPPAMGDYKVFFHVYDDIDKPPIAQRDFYPGNNTLPPGNWFPGTIQDRVEVQLTGITRGNYRMAIGFYKVTTGERLLPQTLIADWEADENSRRLFVDNLEIP